MAINWIAATSGTPATTQRCAGCGRELYRNPEVRVLHLLHDDSGHVSVVSGVLGGCETIEDACTRLLNEWGHMVRADTDARLFAMVNQLDTDAIYIVFRAQVVEARSKGAGGEFDPWIAELVTELQRQLTLKAHRVCSVTVDHGRICITPEHAELTALS